MDDHEHATVPYPADAPPAERMLLRAFAAGGIASIAAAVVLMGVGMYLLPGAPPNLPLPLF